MMLTDSQLSQLASVSFCLCEFVFAKSPIMLVAVNE